MERKALIVAAVVLAFAAEARAGNCGQLFYKQQVYAAPVLAYAAPVYYAAGRDLELRAAVREAFRAELPQAIQELRQSLTAPNGQQPMTQRQATGVIGQKCARCHTGPNPKGGLTLDGQTPTHAEQFVRIVEMLGEGIDVPSEMKRVVDSLTGAEKGSILSEQIAANRSQPKPVAQTVQQQPADLPPPAPVPQGQLQ